MRIILSFLLCLFIPQLALAENTPVGPVLIRGDFDGMKQTASLRADKVIDEQTILMKDGKIVRLLGLEYPQGEEADQPYQAMKLLQSLLPSGTEVLLYQPRNRMPDQKRGLTNRMGHVLGHLVKKTSGQWINGTIVAEGLALAMTDASNPEMADQLYAAEDTARGRDKGLWNANSPAGLLTSESAAQGNGQFRVIEGAVNRAATSKNNLYLNFGNDWRKDFTVMISPGVRKALARKKVDALSLSGRKIRVRGWIREWNGPFMELDTAERLEILPTVSPTGLSTEAVDKIIRSPEAGQDNP